MSAGRVPHDSDLTIVLRPKIARCQILECSRQGYYFARDES